ncbi:outer membrane beta-barrel protein [Spirosoma rigui]|uniref:outer membrane beta-barrel protein n=1 Tax=Spirosoma rigui TaxID=564064 RepID=UPI0009AFB5AB|nr:outer membrane beta-barrel protein [Spirosoma rigui]
MKLVKHLLATVLLATSAASFAQTTIVITSDSTESTITKTRKHVERVSSDFGIYVGFNNFTQSPAGFSGDAGTFRPIGSRFVALAWQKRIPLAVSGSTKLRLITGPEVAWNNFMLEGNNRLVERSNELIVEPSPVALHKSKFVTTQLNLPLMLNVSFRSGFTLGMGAYAGIRLDSYTREKPEGAKAIRTHGSFNLNPVRWGLMTELGFRGTAKLFGRYEPNSPFRTGQGPDAGVWAVGVKF